MMLQVRLPLGIEQPDFFHGIFHAHSQAISVALHSLGKSCQLQYTVSAVASSSVDTQNTTELRNTTTNCTQIDNILLRAGFSWSCGTLSECTYL
jgi:hypothetical protein